jgi:predicted amidohydrolase
VRVGCLQFQPVRGDIAHNIKAIQALLVGVQADLLVLPELANSGYLYADPADLAPYAEDGLGDGPFLSAMRALAGQIGGVIVAGFAETASEGLYNSAAAVTGAGVVQIYRKTHLFADEKSLFLPGNTGFRVFEHGDARIGMMICFDWFFPESARTLALAGAQIIAHPANLILSLCQAAMLTRSQENRVFTITANRFGHETLPGKTLNFTGASQIVDPRGRCLAHASAEGDWVGLTVIDPLAAEDKMITARNHLFEDRRPEMYHVG